jgi:hypothetical protein
MEDRPCCAVAAACKIKQLMINGCRIGLCQIDETLSEIKSMKLESDAEIGETLLGRVKVFNCVASNVSSEYERALLEEYHRGVKS